ncbi:putative reverse transcriptase domain, reverse transcriptase zinc-binding domain protein [Tanacetum coccineum]
MKDCLTNLVDIQKAYDTVDWKFLHEVLVGFGFHPRMFGWIMECVTSTSFSLSINGYLHGYFKGKRGLRQGDPMSPYLFTLVMDVLMLMLKRRARDSDFSYHRYCSKFYIINLCFADDLFLFAHGDENLARVIMDSLEEFKNASGLTPSLPKSTAYFCNVLNHVKLGILNVLPFEEGKLPVKYLGVPLVPSRLVYRDCSELMDRVKRRINDWKNKSLSFAVRVQLIHSVIGEMKKGKAKVAWEDVCLPKIKGGLGIRHLEAFNMALITSHIWSLLTCKESLWVKWIHTYKLNGRSFWKIPIRGKMSWGWRKILQVRKKVRPFIWNHLGNGASVSAWFDNWCALSPLSSIVSNRDIYTGGFRLDSKVHEIIDHGSWSWPNAWALKYPSLVNITVPHLSNNVDRLMWRNLANVDSDFLVAKVWEHLKHFSGISNIPYELNSIVDFLIPSAKLRSARSVIAKLIFAASCYFIWQERNERLFRKKKRSHDQVIDVIKSNVHLKLLACRFKKSPYVQTLLHLWKLPMSLMDSSR